MPDQVWIDVGLHGAGRLHVLPRSGTSASGRPSGRGAGQQRSQWYNRPTQTGSSRATDRRRFSSEPAAGRAAAAGGESTPTTGRRGSMSGCTSRWVSPAALTLFQRHAAGPPGALQAPDGRNEDRGVRRRQGARREMGTPAAAEPLARCAVQRLRRGALLRGQADHRETEDAAAVGNCICHMPPTLITRFNHWRMQEASWENCEFG